MLSTIAVLLLAFSLLTVPWDKSFRLSTQTSVERRWIWNPPTSQPDVSYRLAVSVIVRQLLYSMLGLGALLACGLGLRAHRRQRRVGRGLCPHCAYRLADAPLGCPECGWGRRAL